MTKVKKLENISFYFKICDLIENNKGTKGLIKNIEKVIHFIKKSGEKRGTFEFESEDSIEALKFWKEKFEESQYQDPSWQIYLNNSRQKTTVNLRPILTMLTSSQWNPQDTLEVLMDHITNELLDKENVDDFKEIRETIKQLQIFFDDFVPDTNRFNS
ncbi:MAG: hypothetical protein WD426_09155 [Anditalea sp.]